MPDVVTRVHAIVLAEWIQILNAGSMSRMSSLLVVVAVVGIGPAHAEPATRLGLTLRAELLRDNGNARHILGAHALFVEAGGAERFGKWQIDAYHQVPANSPVPEAHVGIGLELDNQLVPYRYGWQLGLRFSVAPKDVEAMAVCRCNCPTAPSQSSGGGLDSALLFEWMFLFGR